MEFIRLVMGLDAAGCAALNALPERVFESDLQLDEFKGKPIVNADLVLLNMAKRIRKVDIEQLTDPDAFQFAGNFRFRIEIGAEIVISEGKMNLHIP
jgi:hypothetical protein